MDLLAIAEIEQLKYRYLRTLDLKQWDDFAACFVPEARGSYGAGLSFSSAKEIVDFMRANLGPDKISVHHCHHPEITQQQIDLASGRWYLEDKVIMPEHNLVLEGAAFYEDTYVKTTRGWLILETGYQRTYEATYPMDHMRVTVGPALS